MASEARSMVKESDSSVVWLDIGSSISDPLTKRCKLAFLTSGVNSPLLVSPPVIKCFGIQKQIRKLVVPGSCDVVFPV